MGLCLLIAALPWIFGALMVIHVLLRHTVEKGVLILGAGIGGFVGYIGLAFLGSYNSFMLFPIFSIEFVVLLSAASFLALVLLRRRLRGGGATMIGFVCRPLRLLNVVIFCSAIVLLASALLHHLYLPTFGWDVLDHWSVWARRIVEHGRHGIHEELVYEHRHPITLKYILGWFAWVSQLTHMSYGTLVTWFFLGASSVLITVGFSMAILKSTTVAIFPRFSWQQFLCLKIT